MTTALDQVQRWAPIVATFACIAFGTIIWLPTLAPQPVEDRPSGPPAETATPDIGAVLAAGAEELLARPLFHVTRRPPQEVAAPTPAAPAALTLSLMGILNSDDVQIALMRLSNSPDLIRGRVGDQVGPWRIINITQTAVTVLSDDGDLQMLNLSQRQP